ncbi:MAG: SOS response-associated peptidase, partial [Flavobacteriaceae bacterium]|nr:SOS response-associated peptidase [Flavobacteriaceae bacterium]
VAQWGLVPHWVKDRQQQQKFWNNTLNARGETIFEKPAFRDAAKEHRCLIYVDGFYEHHHYKGKTYPYFISLKNGEPMAFAGLWNTWSDRESGEYLTTFSIVTTVGNPLLAQIHNNPKLAGPRMPFIIPEGMEDDWLSPIKDPVDQKGLSEMISSFPADSLQAHTVRRLRGKEYAGNIPGISEPYEYPELQQAS